MHQQHVSVRPTPESRLLAEQVSTALARSAGGQRHFRPPGARHYAPTAMRAPAGPGQLDSRTVYDVCLHRKASVLDQNDGNNRVVHALCRGFRSRFRRNPLGGVFDQTSLFISPPSCVAVGAPPHRTGQAFSPYGRVARTHGDRLVAFDSGDGTTRLPCGHVVARVRGARRAHVCTPWR